MSRWLPLRRPPRAGAPGSQPGPPPADTEDPAQAAAREAERAAAAAAAELLARVKRHAREPADPDAVVADVRAGIADPRTRSATLVQAAPVARRLRTYKHAGAARRVAAAGLESATGGDVRAALVAELLAAELAEGVVPDPERLAAACRDQLAVADRHLAEGNPARGAAWLRSCLELMFHRAVHCDDLVSPLADDAAGFLAPLHASRLYQQLSRPAPGTGERAARPRPAGRPLRLLFVTGVHWQFLEPVLERLEGRDDIEVRRLDVNPAAGGERLPPLLPLLVERLNRLAPSPVPAAQVGPVAALDLLAWADTVVVEWCDEAAVWASLVTPPGKRLVVRLHSVEALSPQTQAVDWSRVDDLVTVSTPLDALVSTVAPASRGVRRHVLPNAVRLADLPTHKEPAADRTLAMVGWASPVKDPMFALDVLAALRRVDPAWRLLLIGSPATLQRPRAMAYRERLDERLTADRDVRGAVEIVGHVAQVARADVGFVLSTSMRESFHVGLVQLAASGAVPVVRDWPVLRPYGGPRELFPAPWVVDDVEGAVRRVLAHADPARRAAEGAAARQTVLDRYDWVNCAARYDALLLT